MKSQSGRSLVEILAVMAIMGIFTIGSIIAFQAGMNSLRAKYILEQVELRVNEATSIAELSKGHKKIAYTPEYINKTSEGAYGYAFETKGVTMDRNSLAYYLADDKAATTVEVTITGKITPGVCQALKGKISISGNVEEINDQAVSGFDCPDNHLSSLTLNVRKK